MNKTITITELNGRAQQVKLTLEQLGDRYFIEAITETCFSLTELHHGYYKHAIDRNTKLRSAKSIKAEQESILESFAAAMVSNKSMIITETELKVENKYSETIYSHGHVFNLVNVKSVQSGQGISWYHHDVYKAGPLTLTLKRSPEGQLQAFANETELYDLEKLKALAESKTFIERKFAFFFYDEVNRLLGREYSNPKSMSGLFA
jgi:hypothetical protein